MATNFINGVNDIDIAIKCDNLSIGGAVNIQGADPDHTMAQKITNLTIVNYSATTTAGFEINRTAFGYSNGVIFSGTLGPSQSVCLIDETRPYYLMYGHGLRGAAVTADNCISFYCATEVYS